MEATINVVWKINGTFGELAAFGQKKQVKRINKIELSSTTTTFLKNFTKPLEVRGLQMRLVLESWYLIIEWEREVVGLFLGASGVGSKVWVVTIGVLEVKPELDSVQAKRAFHGLLWWIYISNSFVILFFLM